MKRVVAKFVPWLLLPEHRAAVADDLIQTATHEPEFLKKIITLKGTEASLSYVQYFLYLVFSSISVSIFHSMWLDTFWTDLLFSIQCNIIQHLISFGYPPRPGLK